MTGIPDVPETPVVVVGYRGFWAKLQGWPTLVVVLLALAFASIVATNAKGFARFDESHERMISEMSLQTCVLSLSAEERVQMRADLNKIRGRVPDALRLWCPWLKEERQ